MAAFTAVHAQLRLLFNAFETLHSPFCCYENPFGVRPNEMCQASSASSQFFLDAAQKVELGYHLRPKKVKK